MNTSIDTLLKQQYIPTLGIVVYSTDEGNHSEKYYLESHAIDSAGQFAEGKPLKAETIAGIGELFRDKSEQETIITGNIPPCLLHYTPSRGGNYIMVWYRPASSHALHFTPELKIKSGLAAVPPMLFMARATGLNVWALPNGKRPTPRTKILDAPFHNVSSGGSVCLGSAKVKTPAVKTFENLIEYWEQMFWASKFSAVHNNAAAKGGLAKLWKAQIANPENPFPMDLLPESKTTYQTLINGKNYGA